MYICQYNFNFSTLEFVHTHQEMYTPTKVKFKIRSEESLISTLVKWRNYQKFRSHVDFGNLQYRKTLFLYATFSNPLTVHNAVAQHLRLCR